MIKKRDDRRWKHGHILLLDILKWIEWVLRIILNVQ